MSLTISVTLGGKPRNYDESKSVNFDWDGIWVYLQPWIQKFNERCSELIDLYELYNLKRTSLPVLTEEMSSALSAARQSPATIKVFLGTQSHLENVTELYESVDRDRLIAVIEKMILITNEAIDSGETLAILGD